MNQLSYPQGLALEADGSLLVADGGNQRVMRFRPGQAEGVVVAGDELQW